MLRIVLVATAAAACFATSSARAAPPAEAIIQVRVSYADLEVASRADAHILMLRIARAAAAVCGGAPDSVIHDDRVRFDRCRVDAYGRAVKQLNPEIIDAVAEYPQAARLADAR